MLFKCAHYPNQEQCHNRRRFAGYAINAIFAIALLLGLACSPVNLAQAGSAQQPAILPAFQENFWDVILNDKDLKKTVLFLRDANKKVLISGDDLHRLHMRLPTTTSLLHQGEAFYRLDELDGVVYHVDDAMQAIAINVPGNLFISSTFSSAKKSPTPIPSSLGGFLNYDGFVQYNQGKAELRALTELGVFNNWGVGTITMLGKNLSQAPKVIRLDSTWTMDMPSSMNTLRFGDAISRPGEWGGAARFGGIQWATNFTTQPQFIPFPMAAVAGEAVLPSTVDVYVNNTLQTRTEVPAGPFSITNVPVLTGQGDALIVVKDLLGREQLITQPFYVAPQLLSQGTHSYSYEAGLIRQNYGLSSFDYGRALVVGTHRYGISDQLTVEVHGEILRQQQTFGVSGSYLWPALGVFNLTLGGSHSDFGSDPFAAIGFQRQSRWFNIAARTRIAGKEYTQLAHLRHNI